MDDVDCIEFGRRPVCDGVKAMVVEEKSAMAAEADVTRLLMIIVVCMMFLCYYLCLSIV